MIIWYSIYINMKVFDLALRSLMYIRLVKVPLDGIPSLQHLDSTTQLGVIYKLAEGVLNPTVCVADSARPKTNPWGAHLACASTMCPSNTAVAVASDKTTNARRNTGYSSKSGVPAAVGCVGEVPVADNPQCSILPVGTATVDGWGGPQLPFHAVGHKEGGKWCREVTMGLQELMWRSLRESEGLGRLDKGYWCRSQHAGELGKKNSTVRGGRGWL